MVLADHRRHSWSHQVDTFGRGSWTQATWGALFSEVTEVQGLVTLFGHETIPNINAKYKHFLELELSSIQNITMNMFFPICDPDGPQWQRNLDLLSANRAPCCDHTVCISRLINLRFYMLIAFRQHIGWTAQARHWLRMYVCTRHTSPKCNKSMPFSLRLSGIYLIRFPSEGVSFLNDNETTKFDT